MIFRQLFDKTSSTYTYVIGDASSRHAAVIDPVLDQVDRDLACIESLGLELAWILDTHVHADHITGAAKLQAQTGAQTAVGRLSGVGCASRHLAEGDLIELGEERIEVLETPGHTAGCLSFHWRDRLFTGDALMIGACGRTDFQEGDAARLFDSLDCKLLTFADETLVYPAHDYEGRRVSCVAQERATNSCYSGRDRQGFVEYMGQLELSPPKLIQIAVPANRRCGRGEADSASPK